MNSFGEEYNSSEMDKAKKLVLEIDNFYDNKFIHNTTKKVELSIGCLNVSLSHHRAIVFLISNGMEISSLSLGRSQYEALIRGTWVYYIMENDIFGKKEMPQIREMNKQLSKFNDFFNDELYKQYCDFTHCGRELAFLGLDIDEIDYSGLDNYLKNSNLIAFQTLIYLKEIIETNNMFAKIGY